MKRTYHALWRHHSLASSSNYVRLNTPTGTILRLKSAVTFAERLLGLISQHKLASDAGLIIEGCRAVHTMGMRIPIDLVFFNRQLNVVKVVAALVPGRVSFCRAAYGVIELASGSTKRLGLAPGTRLSPLDTDAGQFRRIECDSSAMAVGVLARLVLVGLLIAITTACSTANFAGIGQKLGVQAVGAEPDGGVSLIADSVDDVPSDQSQIGLVKPSAPSGEVPSQLPKSGASIPAPLGDDLTKLQTDAEHAYRSGRLSEALAGFTRFAQARPDARAAWFRIGNIHHQRGATGNAMRAYRQAARSGDIDPESLQIRAKALFNIAVIGIEQAGGALESLSAIPTDALLSRESAGLERSLLDKGRMLVRERDRLQGALSTGRVASGADSTAPSKSPNRTIQDTGPAPVSVSSNDSGETSLAPRPAPVELIRGQISQ